MINIMSIDFKIVEDAPEFTNEVYNEFVNLYNSDVMVKNIYKQLDLTPKKYCKLRRKALDNGDIVDRRGLKEYKAYNKPFRRGQVKNYYCNGVNSFVVRKVVDGNQIYFGSYKTESDAKQIVEKLKQVNWDKNELNRIRDEVLI